VQGARVAVWATDPITLNGVVGYLRTSPSLQVVPEKQLAEADVLIVAASQVNTQVMSYLRHVPEHTKARVLLVVEQIDGRDLVTAIEYGVVAVLSRAEANGQRLLNVILGVQEGRAHFPERVQSTLLEQVRTLQQRHLIPNGLTMASLSTRECDVLRLLSEGWLTEEIAEKLSYSERTVKNVIKSILTKMDLRNRTHAVAVALRAGVI
jgi:DNA-binding NarL/FixJ family response regulator